MARTAATDKFRVRDFGTALSFDGVDDYVEVPDADIPASTFTGGFTLAAWIKPSSRGELGGGTDGGRIIDKSNGSGGQTGFLWNLDLGNTVGFRINSGTIRLSGVIPYKSWSHAVVVVDSDGLVTHYINGVASGTPGTTSALSQITTTNALRIGQRSIVTAHTFDGKIDEPRIWSRALTAQEVSDLYWNGTVPTTGLVAEYLFNEGSGTTATDSSGNGNDGTITGATYTSDVPSYERKGINANLVKNGDFEFAPPFTAVGTTSSRWIDGTAAGSATNDVFGWAQVIDAVNCSVSFDSTVSHSGGYSLKVDATDATGRGRAVQGNGSGGTGASLTASTLAQYAIVVSPSTSYTLTYWIKTLNATTGTNRVSVQEHDGSGTRNTVVSPDNVSGTNDWTQVTKTFTTQATTRYIVLSAEIATAGEIKTIWFDDISLTPTTPITRTAATGRVSV